MSKRRRELAACRLFQTAYRIYTMRIGDAPCRLREAGDLAQPCDIKIELFVNAGSVRPADGP
jgi:hypothetical protein